MEMEIDGKQVSIDECVDNLIKIQQQKAEAASKIRVVDGQVLIKTTTEWEYPVPLDECESVDGALRWLMHMSKKSWMTNDMVWRLAEIMSEHAKKKAGTGE